jgi:HK97 family phage prohead protease
MNNYKETTSVFTPATQTALPGSQFPFRSFQMEVKNLTPQGFLEGYASTFTPDRDKDIIIPGAFRHTLKEWREENKSPFLLWQHRLDEPIGRWIELQENTQGLYVKGQLLMRLRRAQEAHALIQAGILQGLSIGFKTVVSQFDRGRNLRKIFQLKLFEISIVTLPANPLAQINQFH